MDVIYPRFEIGQVASLLGYRHQSSFARWFVGHFGTTPSAWQAAAARPYVQTRQAGR